MNVHHLGPGEPEDLFRPATYQDMKELTRSFSEWARRMNREGIPRRIDFGKTVGAGPPTYTYLDAGGPKVNRIWDLRRLSMSGIDSFTALAGANAVAIVYSGPPLADGATQAITGKDLFMPSSAIPFAQLYKDQVTIWNPERVVIVVKGAAAQAQLLGGMQVMELSTEQYLLQQGDFD